MHAKYEVSISYSPKVTAKVKVDNRQKNKQTGQKQYMPPIVSPPANTEYRKPNPRFWKPAFIQIIQTDCYKLMYYQWFWKLHYINYR